MNFKEFGVLIPDGVDIRPLLPDVVRMYTRGNEKAFRSPFGPDGYVITQAEKDCSFWKPDQRKSNITTKQMPAEESFKDYSKMVDAWKRKDKRKRGDKNRAEVVFYWFFRFVREPVFFMQLANSVWEEESDEYLRLAFAKLAGSKEDTFETIAARFCSPIDEVKNGCLRLKSSHFRSPKRNSAKDDDGPRLIKFWSSSSKFHFSKEWSKLEGRDEETDEVVQIFQGGKGFRWTQISGPAGSGKTRLASYAIEAAPGNWNSGFLSTSDQIIFLSSIESWEPKAPTLVVLDYVLARTDATAKLLQMLARNSDHYSFPVRVVLVERQPWKFVPDIAASDLNVVSHDVKFRSVLGADWYYGLYEHRDDISLETENLLVHKGLIQLSEISPSAAFRILVDLVEPEKLAGHSNLKLLNYISKLGAFSRPLFVLFLADSLNDGTFQFTWNKTDLLEDVLVREERHNWTSLPSPSSPWSKDRSSALELAVIFTILSFIDAKKLVKAWPEVVDYSQDSVLSSMQITGNEIWSLKEIETFVGMEPDLLGEWFVLREIERHSNAKEMISRAWRLDTGKTRAFLLRVIEDFPDSGSLEKLFDFSSLDLERLETYEEIALDVVQKNAESKKTLPNIVYQVLRHSAHAECITAAAFCRLNEFEVFEKSKSNSTTKLVRLSSVSTGAVERFVEAFLLERGWGCVRNVPRSLELYQEAASLGHLISSICLYFSSRKRAMYELPKSADEYLLVAVENLDSKIGEEIFKSGRKASNSLSSNRKKVHQYSEILLSDAANFFTASARSNRHRKEYSDLQLENAQTFGEMARILSADPTGVFEGQEVRLLASKLLFDMADFFDSLSHGPEADVQGRGFGKGIRTDTMGWAMMENASVYAYFGELLSRDPMAESYGMPPQPWWLTVEP